MNDHLHPLFRKLLEPLMSKPRTQAELDAQAKLDEGPDFNQELNLHSDTIAERFDSTNEMPTCQSVGGECPYPGACRAQHSCTCAGGVQPGVNTSLRGRTYERVCIGALPDSNIPVYEQIETWSKP